MCRFVAYLGPALRVADLITRPSHSIIHQSYRARERVEPLNGDGFGLAWYTPFDEVPALFKDVSPAWNNLNLRDLARAIESETILAHVRAATQGLSVMRANCHPFAHQRFAFMHNGNIGQFARVRRRILRTLSDEAFTSITGTTDSEHAFGLWIDRWRAVDVDEPMERMRLATIETLRAIESLAEPGAACTLNFGISDGRRFVACRAVFGDDPGNTLYWRAGSALRCEAGCSLMDDGEGAVLVASEPLFDHASWTAVPMGSILCVDERRRVEITAAS